MLCRAGDVAWLVRPPHSGWVPRVLDGARSSCALWSWWSVALVFWKSETAPMGVVRTQGTGVSGTGACASRLGAPCRAGSDSNSHPAQGLVVAMGNRPIGDSGPLLSMGLSIGLSIGHQAD